MKIWTFTLKSLSAIYQTTPLLRPKKRTPVKLLSSNQVLPPVHRTAYAKTNDPNYQTLAGIGDVFNDPAIGAPSVPQASKPTIYGARTGKLPDKQLTNQYLVTNPTDLQSLTPINGNVFGRDKKPADQRVFVEPNDPNYHVRLFNQNTLARIRQDIFGPDKKANVSIARGPIVPFDQNAKAATKDPNYQTLAGINADIFGEDKKNKNDWPKAPVPPIDCGKKVDARDPNYQSLAGIGNDIFGPDKKQYDAAVPKVPHAPIDQNTKTLAAINNDIFGADKKK
ncbi:hypothetical protein M3Y98_00909000 [Aphelenchoides besseyi]|nr:hypothetical protein M3Y98_00909000 [Aphelenchoides besseyi]